MSHIVPRYTVWLDVFKRELTSGEPLGMRRLVNEYTLEDLRRFARNRATDAGILADAAVKEWEDRCKSGEFEE